MRMSHGEINRHIRRDARPQLLLVGRLRRTPKGAVHSAHSLGVAAACPAQSRVVFVARQKSRAMMAKREPFGS